MKLTTLGKILWRDECGEVSSMGMLLMTAILALGAIVGLTTLRDQIVQEMGDLAIALESLDQSFTSPNATFIDLGPFPTDPANDAPACIDFIPPP